ncbi:hypothetical protein CFOL_v3_10402 [Cephalotus follicularis]|uniref:Uncharacterized protein n=1 Tax=Cephalotus follicularis TaxID=3775 RepID=A0A1Q3BGB3_CEPFO|nr:hypothetical protein CFOL_v3_10402 [Cephalotus follicularis]
MDSFDTLLNKIELSHEHALSLFLAGLKPEIQLPLRLLNPQTLQLAYSMVKLQESVCATAVTGSKILVKTNWKPSSKPTYTPPLKSLVNFSQNSLKHPSNSSGSLTLPPPSTKLPSGNPKFSNPYLVSTWMRKD